MPNRLNLGRVRGNDGITPHIGGNGNWFVGDQDTGVAAGGTGGTPYEIGAGLALEGNVLRVDTAEAVEADNTRPVTSAAVYTELGNIEALLANL